MKNVAIFIFYELVESFRENYIEKSVGGEGSGDEDNISR